MRKAIFVLDCFSLLDRCCYNTSWSHPKCLPSVSGRCFRLLGSPARGVSRMALVNVSGAVGLRHAVSPEWLWSVSPRPSICGPRCLPSGQCLRSFGFLARSVSRVFLVGVSAAWISGAQCLPSVSGRCFRSLGFPAHGVFRVALVGVFGALGFRHTVSPEWLWSVSPGPWASGPQCLPGGSGRCLRGSGSPTCGVSRVALVRVSAALDLRHTVSPEWLWSVFPRSWISGTQCLPSGPGRCLRSLGSLARSVSRVFLVGVSAALDLRPAVFPEWLLSVSTVYGAFGLRHTVFPERQNLKLPKF